MALLLSFVAVASFFNLYSPNIPDLDSFYYSRLAWIYRTRGPFDVDFPWTQYSAIKTFSSSLWYGFGIFLVPFTYFNNLVIGIKLAGVFLTAAALWTYYSAIKISLLKPASLWPFLFFFSAANVTAQFLMVRPQIISLPLSALLFSLLIRRSEITDGPEFSHATAGLTPIFLTSFGIAWFHLNFVWLPVVITCVVVVVRLIVEKKMDLAGTMAIMGGLILGWLARPRAVDAARLLYIQTVEPILAKHMGNSLLWGNENLPLNPIVLTRNFIPFILLWIAAISIAAWMAMKRVRAGSPSKYVLMWSSLALSVGSFFLTMFVARRSYDLWTMFGTLFIAAVYAYLFPLFSWRREKTARNVAMLAILGTFTFMAFDSVSKTTVSMDRFAYPPDMLKEVASWVKKNSQPGDVVFNLHWSHFSPLFFWNQQNYYVGALDPIFQYAYNPSLYWKFHHLSADQAAEQTCGAMVCAPETLEDTYAVLVRDFKAKYLLLSKLQNPLVYDFLENDSRFENKFETGREAVFLIK